MRMKQHHLKSLKIDGTSFTGTYEHEYVPYMVMNKPNMIRSSSVQTTQKVKTPELSNIVL